MKAVHSVVEVQSLATDVLIVINMWRKLFQDTNSMWSWAIIVDPSGQLDLKNLEIKYLLTILKVSKE